MIIGIIIIVIILILAGWLISAYNNFVKMKNKIEEAFATMDVYLKKRWDLVPNLVATVQGYATHEKETFEHLAALRSRNYDSMSPNEKIEANQALGASLGTLIATAEAYPELKANENFLQLQNQLNQLEDDIANSRKYYNGCVRQMNTAVESFPSNIIANIFHFDKYKMYEVDDPKERQNVVVDFGNAAPQPVAPNAPASAAPVAPAEPVAPAPAAPAPEAPAPEAPAEPKSE